MKVEVKKTAIRHNGTLYSEGASFSVTAEQYERIKQYVEVLEDEPSEPAAGKAIDDMTIPELKAYAAGAEPPIDLGDATKKEDILAKIKAALNPAE
jgi:hypothetical protein